MSEIFRLTQPPVFPSDLNSFDYGVDNYEPWFVHIHFPGFTYGLVVPQHIARDRSIFLPDEAFLELVFRFTEKYVAPQIENLGRQNRLFLLKNMGPTHEPVLEELGSYRELAPETARYQFDQAMEFFYFPPIWFKSNPLKTGGILDFDEMQEVVLREKLPHSQLQVSCSRDGEFIFDFSDWPPASLPIIASADPSKDIRERRIQAHALRLKVINVFLTCLYSSSIEASASVCPPTLLSSGDKICRMSIDDSNSFGAVLTTMRGLKDARFPINYGGNPHFSDWRISCRNAWPPPLPTLVVTRALEFLDSVLQLSIEKGVGRVELYGRACSALRDANYDLALGQAWLAIESLLFELQAKHLNRIGALLPRKPTAAEATKVLKANKILSDSFCDDIDINRDHRNDLIHRLIPSPPAVATKAIEILEKLLKHSYQFNFVSLPHYEPDMGTSRQVT